MAQFSLEREVQAGTTQAPLSRAWPVERQLEHDLLTAQLRHPVIELALTLATV
ncbi:hypothetical protein D3C76_1744700 [compost metagenome]